MRAPSELPYPLALLRIVLPLVIVLSPELYDASDLVRSPERMDFVPEGLGIAAHLPLTPDLVRCLQILALSSAATMLLGWMSRASAAVLTVSAGLLFSLSQRSGAVVHDMHLFWLSALLAASPCGDVWSLDAWETPVPNASPRYGVPITFARLLLGLVYFFPGLHKLLSSGIAWASADNVIHHMHAKWLEHGEVPFFRIDRVPVLCAIGAACVILFELSFVVLALHSARTRRLAIVGGLLFHASTQLFFFIRFTSLWSLYVVLLDGAWLGRLDRRFLGSVAIETRGARNLPALITGALLVLGVVAQGLRGQTQAWPFACYPTFGHLQSAQIPEIEIVVERRDGTVVRLTGRESRRRSQAEWGHVFRISGAYGDAPNANALRAHAAEVLRSALPAGRDLAPITRVRVFRAMVSTHPDAWTAPPELRALLLELEPPFEGL